MLIQVEPTPVPPRERHILESRLEGDVFYPCRLLAGASAHLPPSFLHLVMLLEHTACHSPGIPVRNLLTKWSFGPCRAPPVLGNSPILQPGQLQDTSGPVSNGAPCSTPLSSWFLPLEAIPQPHPVQPWGPLSCTPRR